MATAAPPQAETPPAVSESSARERKLKRDRARKQKQALLKTQLRNARQENQELKAALEKAGEGPNSFRLHRQRRLDIVDQPLILISQLQRSGGTLLSQLLDAHPECHSHPYELKWGRPDKWDWPKLDLHAESGSQFDALDEDWIREFSALGLYAKAEGQDSVLARLKRWESVDARTDAAHPFIFDRPLQHLLFEGLVGQPRPTRQRQFLDAYLTGFFGAWLDYQNQYHRPKRFVTAFTPRVQMHAESLGRFFADYPDGFLVSLIRHPAAWYASATKHDPRYADRDTAIDLWTDSTRATIAAGDKFGDRVITIIFEDLVAHTETVMRRLCERVGLAYNETLTRPTFNGIPMASNSQFARSTQVDPQVNQRYRTILNTDDLTAIETRALPMYESARGTFGLDR